MTLTYDSDHVTRGVARLIERYRRPRTSALLASWLAEVQEAEDALWALLVERTIDTAVGDQLDVLGRIVGEPRRGRGDETYRLWIRARNAVSRSGGTTREILSIARTLVAPTDSVALEEYYPAAFLVRLEGDVGLSTGYQIAYMLRQAKPAGVLFQMTWQLDPDGENFRFAPGNTPVPASPHGFDEGAWVVVADGSFILEDDTLPDGALVIEGVPLVIEGAYIVIRPGAATAVDAPAVPDAPPIVAPARIVPRPLPSDPQAFALRTTTVVDEVFVELGLWRYEGEPRPATLAAELSGRGAELQLWNLTVGAEVARLTGGATSARIDLVPALYSVRLRRGPSAGARVSCRRVEVTL